MALKNRVIMAPMLTNYSDGQCRVTDRHLAYYGARARGGVGLVVVEGTCVHLGGRGFPLGLGCWEHEQVAGLASLAGAIHQGGARAVLQLYHAGRQTRAQLAGAQPVAPSPLPCPRLKEMPRELNQKEIGELVEAFARAAFRARTAGFDAVELHGAHGYLINQFLSPYSNQRSDAYGGDRRGRARFPMEIIRRIHQLAGADFPVICRISADEFVEGGIKAKEAQDIARMLEEAGVAAIHVSAGVYGSMPPTAHPHGTPFGVFAHLAEKVKAVVRVPVIAVGRITRPSLAEDLLQNGKADLVALGRALIADPEWAHKAQEGRPEDIVLCPGCNACNQRAIRPQIICLVNPLAGREGELTLSSAALPKKVVVVGGGLTGLLAARVAAQRGHRVTLYQDSTQPGGLLGLRGQVPHLGEWAETMGCFARQAALAGVKTQVEGSLTPEAVRRLGAEAVIVALSGPAVRPSASGLMGDKVFTFDQALNGQAHLGERVTVLGGGLMGVEVACYLAGQSKRVTIVEEGEALACDTHPSNRYYLLQWMKEAGVQVMTGARVTGAARGVPRVLRHEREEALARTDSVVLALGYGSTQDWATLWRGTAPEVYLVEDPYEAYQGTEATCEAVRIAMEI